MASPARELIKEAKAYRAIGHQQEGCQIVRIAQAAYPNEVDDKTVKSLEAPAHEGRMSKLAGTMADWLYLPAVISAALFAAWLLSNVLFVESK